MRQCTEPRRVVIIAAAAAATAATVMTIAWRLDSSYAFSIATTTMKTVPIVVPTMKTKTTTIFKTGAKEEVGIIPRMSQQQTQHRQASFLLFSREKDKNTILTRLSSSSSSSRRRVHHPFQQTWFVAATIFWAFLTSSPVSINIHNNNNNNHHFLGGIQYFVPSVAQARTNNENQQLIADIWFAVDAQFFDYTYNGLGEEGWRNKEQEAMKAVAETGPEDVHIVEDAIQGMLASLNDPYTRYLNKEKYAALTAYATHSSTQGGGEVGGGIGVQLLEDPRTNNVMIMETTLGGPADLAGMQRGDVIVKIDGMDVKDMSAEVVANKCRGLPGDTVDIDFLRNFDNNNNGDDKNNNNQRNSFDTGRNIRENYNGEEKTKKLRHVTLARMSLTNANNDIQVSTFLSNGGKTIGVIKIPSFTTETVAQLVKELRLLTSSSSSSSSSSSIDALAIDLRGNVGGYMPAGVDTAKLFLPARAHIIAEIGQSSSTIKAYDADGIGAEVSLPLYILVDEHTASASEIFASALQENRRAVIVGKTNTFGKGRIQNVQPLQDGSGLAVTRARYITASGRDLQGVGIPPDIKPEKCEARDSVPTCLADIVSRI